MKNLSILFFNIAHRTSSIEETVEIIEIASFLTEFEKMSKLGEGVYIFSGEKALNP